MSTGFGSPWLPECLLDVDRGVESGVEGRDPEVLPALISVLGGKSHDAKESFDLGDVPSSSSSSGGGGGTTKSNTFLSALGGASFFSAARFACSSAKAFSLAAFSRAAFSASSFSAFALSRISSAVGTAQCENLFSEVVTNVVIFSSATAIDCFVDASALCSAATTAANAFPTLLVESSSLRFCVSSFVVALLSASLSAVEGRSVGPALDLLPFCPPISLLFVGMFAFEISASIRIASPTISLCSAPDSPLGLSASCGFTSPGFVASF
mmetsp:Transcript_7768/g.14269  ORF Transcript_7768/g.14269 Transcript_7768/m.14269 type:complete len:268 (+) Transcript_7768:254-1057(+)